MTTNQLAFVKAIAEHRQGVMENFLEEFKQEWDSIL